MRTPKLFADQSANSTVEYALVIALVATALMLSGQGVQFGFDLSFREPSAAPDGLALQGDSSTAPESASAATSPSLSGMQPSRTLAWAGLTAAAILICYSCYRRRRMKQQLEELHCGPESIADDPCNPNFIKRQEIQRVLLSHFDNALDGRIEVKQVMSRRVHSVQPTVAVEDVREIMEREGFHHLLVIKQGNLLGVISDRDFKSRRGWLARHIMTACPLTVSPNTQLCQAITMLLHQRISCLPVVDHDKVCGIMTATDMLMTLQCLIKLLERDAAGEDSAGIKPASVSAAQALLEVNAPVAAC